MSTSAQQAGTLSHFPGICALHALLLSVDDQMVGRASREHLSGGDPLWHTICALHALPSITKVHEYLPAASDDQTSHLETPCRAGASMHPLDQGSRPRLGLSPRYPGSAGALVWRLDRAQFILRPGWTWLVQSVLLHPCPCGGDTGSGYPYPANR